MKLPAIESISPYNVENVVLHSCNAKYTKHERCHIHDFFYNNEII